jgi:hypothetical protein
VGETGKAVGIDHIDDLVKFSVENVEKDKPELFSSGRVTLVGNTLLYCHLEMSL